MTNYYKSTNHLLSMREYMAMRRSKLSPRYLIDFYNEKFSSRDLNESLIFTYADMYYINSNN